jgi:hypothetical protein
LYENANFYPRQSHAQDQLAYFSALLALPIPQISLFSPTHPHMRTFTDNDDINMPDPSSVRHSCGNIDKSLQQLQLPFIIFRPRKTNFRFPFPFTANRRKFAVSLFHCWKQTEDAVSPVVLYCHPRVFEIKTQEISSFQSRFGDNIQMVIS